MIMIKKIVVTALVLFLIFGLMFFNKAGQPKGLVAFVIDDWGYNRRNLDLVFQIDRPLTFSILPNLRYSGEIADAAGKNPDIYDIILHLPLESMSNRAAEINTIRISMEQDEILSVLEDDIKSIPGIIGVSNHQGSKATADKRVMGLVLKELNERGLFFLDSVTTPDTVCPDIAGNTGLKYVQRDVFLDITDQTDQEHFDAYVRKQIKELADVALEKGYAVGIGHNLKVTLEAIKEAIPELEKQGLKIVGLKELVK